MTLATASANAPLTNFRTTEPSAPPSQPAPTSLFAAHGVWAPGVRLMRNISFAYKALIICALFMVPLAMALYFFVASQNDQIQFAKNERHGVAVISRLNAVQAGVLSIRNVTRASLGGGWICPAAMPRPGPKPTRPWQRLKNTSKKAATPWP